LTPARNRPTSERLIRTRRRNRGHLKKAGNSVLINARFSLMNILPIPSRKTQGNPNLPLATTSKVNAAFYEFKVLMIRIFVTVLESKQIITQTAFRILVLLGWQGIDFVVVLCYVY